MEEAFLHYVWKYKLFPSDNLFSTEGEEVSIKAFGFSNQHAGPDFSEGKVRIGSTTWAGNIEIHVKSSDWYAHKHQEDKVYDSVILHVVYKDDKPVRRANGALIPTIELSNWIPKGLYERYRTFVTPKIPCYSLLNTIDNLHLHSFKEQMLFERFDRKIESISKDLKQSVNDLEQVFFEYLVKSLGGKINQLPFQLLAKQSPTKLFNKSDNLFVSEAILFGNAGFLNEKLTDDYHKRLMTEYDFQKKKHNFKPLDKSIWKFSKLRPVSFPTVRIAQLARLISSNSNLFSSLVKSKPSYYTTQKLLAISLDEGYWHDHYTFDKASKPKQKSIGKQTINSIIINAILPFSYLYGKKVGDASHQEYVIDVLEQIKAENNSITREFEEVIPMNNAFDSQAIIEVYNNYCTNKKCLSCPVGIKIMNTPN